MGFNQHARLLILFFACSISACGTFTAPPPTTSPTRPIETLAAATQFFTSTPNATFTLIPLPTQTPTLTQTEQNELSAQFISAATQGDTTRVLELIQQGAPLNAQDARGRTAVMAATYGNHVETARVLIEKGADVNVRDAMLNNPFLYAGAEGYLEILKMAYAAGADPKITNRFGGTALIPACERGHVEVVKYLLTETSVDVNHINNLGWTCLLEAIILSDGGVRHQEIVKFVIDHGADVNIADKEGITPLQHAKQRGFREIQTLLENAGTR